MKVEMQTPFSYLTLEFANESALHDFMSYKDTTKILIQILECNLNLMREKYEEGTFFYIGKEKLQ